MVVGDGWAIGRSDVTAHGRSDGSGSPADSRRIDAEDTCGVEALYVHVPFCRRRCDYCDFATAAIGCGDSLIDEYLSALIALLGDARGIGVLGTVRTAYVGGGTPSFVGVNRLWNLLDVIGSCAPQTMELTVEANPDSLTDDFAHALPEAGVTRVSVGVQALNDAELRTLGRIHDAAGARRALVRACATGLDVSVDLMCATPLQSDASFVSGLHEIIELGIGHVSVYPLTIEEGTPLARRLDDAGDEASWNAPDIAAHRMELAAGVLGSAGLSRYEVASYARQGGVCHHNCGYWTGREYLGVGTAAASMLGARSYDLLRHELATQLPARPADVTRCRLVMATSTTELVRERRWDALRLEVEFMTRRQAVAEDLMLGMRMTRGVGRRLLSHAHVVMGDELDATIDRVVGRGLARWSHDRLVPTMDGWLLGNVLYGELWDLAGGAIRTCVCGGGDA